MNTNIIWTIVKCCLAMIASFAIGLWPLTLFLPYAFYLYYKKKAEKEKELLQEQEDREKEILRMENEILMHLIQDKHRNDGDEG